jgi:hypothetical protein
MSRTARRAILLAILALAAGLRLAGLGFGLAPPAAGPVIHPLARPDEQYVWNIAFGICAGDPNPHFFVYPSLFLYVLAAADFAYVTAASLAHGSREAVEAALASDPRPLILIDRGLVAAIGALTVLLVYRLAAAAFGRPAGLVAALLLAVPHLHVRDSHFGVTDVPLAALVCAVLVQVLRIESRGLPRDYLRAGLLTGLAISTRGRCSSCPWSSRTGSAAGRVRGAPRRSRWRSPWSSSASCSGPPSRCWRGASSARGWRRSSRRRSADPGGASLSVPAGGAT